jgi:hypothetical protein
MACAPRTSIVLAVLTLGAGAAPASAATGSFEVGRLAGPTAASETIPVFVGPRPAGDVVVFASGTAARGWSIRLGAPALAQREIARVPPEPGSTLGLLASPTRVAAMRHAAVCNGCSKYDGAPTTLDGVLASPLAGPLTTLAQCRPASGGCMPAGCSVSGERYRAALDGDLLALSDGCTATTVLRDLATGVTRSLGSAIPAAVAGSFVAVAEPAAGGQATVVVRDAATGNEVYRAAVPIEAHEPLLVLLADGSTVYSAVVSGRRVLVVATPAAPAGRVLRVLAPGAAIAGAGAAEILLTTSTSQSGGSVSRHLEIVRVDGGLSPAAGLDLRELVGDIAFDGRTAVWAQRRCVTTVVTSWWVGEPAPPPPDLRCAPPLPSRAAVTLARSRLLRVVLACPAGAGRGGCQSTLALTAVRRGPLPRGANGAERLWALGRASVALDQAERAPAELRVSRDAARWLRRHAPMRLRVQVRSQAARPSLVRRTVALRVAR